MLCLKKIITTILLSLLFYTSIAQSGWNGILDLVNKIGYTYYLIKVSDSVVTNPKIDGLLQRIATINNILPKCAKLSKELNPPAGSADYQLSIKNYQDILYTLSAPVRNFNYSDLADSAALNNINTYTDTLLKTFSFIEEDVYLKFLANQDNKEFIKVNVQVLDSSGTQLPGYNVFVKPFISSDPSMIVTFNPTNMASKNITAGWKLFWIEKNNQKLQSRDWHIKTSDPSSQSVVFVLNH